MIALHTKYRIVHVITCEIARMAGRTVVLRSGERVVLAEKLAADRLAAQLRYDGIIPKV